ncbi:hypothetical protein C9374_001415 [Naegleria lovaniensis]|uniref:Uncharacterized protein n=1 Tax=Naegleria lovaniensis TaxID=51637 RepID=A0AA88KNP5_NAELO|nr:uncharacterized protein C9374_001415 [Naegleria lovaniensis]KAG2387821.1 hypothetical protein C9374_001415 [Naegleria lovaniensis]
MLLNKGTDSYGSFMSFLLRQYYMTSHNIEMAIHNEIQRDPSVLSKFITSHWKEACKGELRPWKRYSHTEAHHRWYHSTLTTDLGTTIIEIDVLRGSFLVDGAPVGRLSSSVTAHPDYIRLFSNYVFDVQPGSVKGTYVTRAQINGAFYKFSQFGDTIEIIEQRPERELKLFSDTFFGTDLPYGFVNDYSHWFDCVSNEILFRPKSFFDPNFVSEVEYILDLNENVLTEKSTGRKLLDVHGGIFREILKPMSRIEDSLFLHLFVNATMDEITLDLPRKGLHFTLMEYKYLKSKEFDMNVVEHCNIGTLIGLRSGIVLESKNCERIILVPCGALHVSRKNETGHQQVQIINSDREYPVKYFAYRVNNLLWQLEGEDNLSSWLFLALLHATTSSVVEDPSQDKQAQRLPKLSPTREYYPYHLHEMENATWPADIPSMAAHDAFIIIASKIYEHSQSLSFLYPQPMKDEKKQPPFPHSLFLNERAYFQSINKYNSNAWLSCDNYSTKQVSNFSLPKKQLEPSSKQDTIRRLAWSSRTKSLYVTANIQYEVYGKMTELKQVQEFPSVVEWFTLDDIHCYFLSLYHIVVTKSNSFVTFLLSYLGYKHGSRYETLLAYLLAIHNRRKQFPQLPATTKKLRT